MARSSTVLNRAKRLDRFMTWIISLGGMLIIAAVLGILVFIARESFPLFRSPRTKELASFQQTAATALLVEETGKAAAALDSSAGVRAFSLRDGQILQTLQEGPGRPWLAHSGLDNQGQFLVLGCDGTLGRALFKWDKPAVGGDDPQKWAPTLTWQAMFPSGIKLKALLHWRELPGGGLEGGSSMKLLALDTNGELVWAMHALESRDVAVWKKLPIPGGQTPCAGLWSLAGDQVFIGTREGSILFMECPEGEEPRLVSSTSFGEGITALGFALGENSLLVGGEKGSLRAFQPLRGDGEPSLQAFHQFESLPGPVLGFTASLRDKRFLSWCPSGIAVDHLTTERRLFFRSGNDFQCAALSPRGDYILASSPQGFFRSWHLDAPHPELSFRTLWRKTHYEGYGKPEYVWQSTGGSDDFEPKLSLVPLVFGTLKGTLFAMIFALPLAIFGALYTSQFATLRLRNTIKPLVEVMAALPSVVLGFLAGLVLAPLFERAAIQVLVLPFATLVVALVLLPLWARLPRRFHTTWGNGREVVWLIPVLLLGLLLALVAAPCFERIFLGGDFRAWLLQHQNITYDQRNSIVVGFAMGFAVIPIIFTISEDALTSVPRSLTSASLACGASPWQTAWRVVLPTASPGIFSSVMVGFGRAIGETMIVLMATGNTPVMDWNPFNGMRTLAANIAVETPEAPVHGTLYRVLFLTALLLFLLTFLLNTVAELVRQHLRKRYESL